MKNPIEVIFSFIVLTAVTLATVALLSGCGTGMATAQFHAAPACTTVTTPTGATITCPDGNTTTISNGQAGATGPSGSTGATGAAGTNGTNGSNGTNAYSPGLSCTVYSILPADESGTVNWFKMFTDGTIKFNTVLTNFNVPNESSTTVFSSFTAAQQALIGYTDYAIDCHGYLNAPVSGAYTFTLGSDDGSELVIDDQSIINMPDLQAYAQKSNTVNLYSGQHEINVFYFQGPPVMIGLTLSWQGPSNDGLGTQAVIPVTYLTH